jgi:hypothetical protein
MPINDAKRRGNDLAQMLNGELRNDTAHPRVGRQEIDPGEDVSNDLFSGVRRAF